MNMRTERELKAAIDRIEARRHRAGAAGRYEEAKFHAAARDDLRSELAELRANRKAA